ncbi:hypothetical protein KUTeg_022819 [Tegillarca granosa]|uniref:Cytochrome P450 n=1 Tax=Tegillarca granosa TaxID=220873 RepID=A0ABQ9DZT7_TEGGR|nr:hypothetical protein KUTeg_022819 [Tegillarca granosa]
MWSGISILLHRLDIQEKLQAEVDGVVGFKRQPCLADRVYMPYTDAFVLEVLRYISHIFPNLWKVHHDSSVYPEPFEFKPERFLDVNGDILPADHIIRQNMLSFSIGKRSCIGEVFAKNRLFMFFSTLMQNFIFLPEENSPKFDPHEMEIFIVHMPKRFKCRVQNRHEVKESTEA